MKNILSILTFSLCTLAWAENYPPQTVSDVSLSSYLGKWYEIARIPNKFQNNRFDGYGECNNTTAEYSTLPGDKIAVKNTCSRFNNQDNSQTDIAEAVAFVVDGSQNSKLKVNFTGFAILRWLNIGNGDYWILALGELNSEKQYSWALVGSPTREYGWILSRTPELTPGQDAEISTVIMRQGYTRDQFKVFKK
jgi:apolipoprotein D and lipocalin family protein